VGFQTSQKQTTKTNQYNSTLWARRTEHVITNSFLVAMN
jgi:hypothetical protein